MRFITDKPKKQSSFYTKTNLLSLPDIKSSISKLELYDHFLCEPPPLHAHHPVTFTKHVFSGFCSSYGSKKIMNLIIIRKALKDKT